MKIKIIMAYGNIFNFTINLINNKTIQNQAVFPKLSVEKLYSQSYLLTYPHPTA